jgi:ribosomal protein S10
MSSVSYLINGANATHGTDETRQYGEEKKQEKYYVKNLKSRNHVYFLNDEDLYVNKNVLISGYTIYITVLPKNYTTEKDVKILVEDVLQIGYVNAVNIVEKQTEMEPIIKYKSAMVIFNFWYSSENTFRLLKQLNNVTDEKTVKIFKDDFQFQWDTDGSKMGYISVQKKIYYKIKQSMMEKNEETKMFIPNGEWKGLYIPQIEDGLHFQGKPFQAEDLTNYIEKHLRIGKVQRLDVIDRDDLLTSENEVPIKAAFVHMEYWYQNPLSAKLRGYLNTHFYGYRIGENDFTRKNEKNEMESRYIVLKINHKPIDDHNVDSSLTMEELQNENKKLKNEYNEQVERFITVFEESGNKFSKEKYEILFQNALLKIEDIHKKNMREIFVLTKKSDLKLNIYQLFAINCRIKEDIDDVKHHIDVLENS